MKYKNIELELPPLGEIVVVKEEKGKVIGEFYLDGDKKKQFHKRCNLQDYWVSVNSIEGSFKWGHLPKFKSVEKELPPTGIDVLVGCSSFDENVLNCFNISHFIKGQKREYAYKNTSKKEIPLDSWLPLEAFNEDK